MNSETNKSLLIVGCGWVGKKLGQNLSSSGYTVYGTTRSESNFESLSEVNIQPVQLELPVNSSTQINLPDTDSVLISISPGRRGGQQKYVDSINQLSSALAHRNAQVIMYSSTSAYGDSTNITTEEDAEPNTESDNHILAAEGALRSHLPQAVILRLSGLYGQDRHPVKYMAGRSNLSDGDAPANLVHREDVIQVTRKIMEAGIKSEIFNVCSPAHPTREEVYTTLARRKGLEVPTFQSGGADGKLISPEKLIKELNIEFIHPDPVAFMGD